MHNNEEIKAKAQEILANTPDNIIGVGYGYKISNGQQTNELALIYSVKEKKAISELLPEEIIPSSINLSSGVIKTDVKVVSKIEALACNGDCAQMAGPNSALNRSLQRPLMGGLSITSKNNVSTVGTLGFIAVDTATQALVGITNNHVTIQDAFYTAERNLAGIVKNEYSPIDYIYQNGESGTIPPSNYIIGQSLRYVPIYEDDGINVNYVDGAMFSLQETDISLSTSFKQVGESYSSPLPFATTSEINSLLFTNPMLYSSGRTTGPKGGTLCPVRVNAIHTSTIAQYKKQGSYIYSFFTDVIEFVKPENDPNLATICEWPVRGGDSGSALIADFSGVRKIIGLVYAGGFDLSGTAIIYGYACRIDKIAAELGIEAWDGTLKNYVDPATIEYKTTTDGSYNKTITCDGKTYWQVGLTTSSNPC